MLHRVFPGAELAEALLHHVLHPELLNAQQVQYHRIGDTELGLELRRLALE